jgi:riboflavin biosynthesis pyrimidine reductase
MNKMLLAATLAFYSILLLYLSHTCLGSTAASYTSADFLAPTRSNLDDKILDAHDVEKVRNETDATKIKHILDRISSWMKEKRKTDNKRNNRQEYNVNHDITRQFHRPFVTLAYAQSLDGMIATQTNHGKEEGADVAKSKNLQLSCPTSMELTHKLRNIHDAILVGGTTFRLDQPRLNVRLASSTSSSSSSKLSSHEIIQQPMPVILDTNLQNLQHLLFNRTISNTDLDSWHQSTTKDTTLQLPDIILRRIKAKNPTICCSSEAAKSFLDILEVIVQDQEEYASNNMRKKKKTYSITVYKTIEDGAEEESITSTNNNNYLPIKITIRIETHHHHHRNSKNVNDDTDLLNELTFTLLPCQTITKIRQTDANNNCDVDYDEHATTTTKLKKKTNSHILNLRHVLHQLHTQFDIYSIMVEGGSSILSSFINECCYLSGGNYSNSDSSIVDCICVTIAPKIIGGKWGLPVLGGLAVDSRSSNFDSDPCDKLITIKNGEFVTLGGQDCTFLCRIRLKEGLHSLSTTN